MEHELFNVVDLAAVIVVAAGLLTGLRRGLFAEIPRFIGIVLVLLAGLFFYLPFGDLLMSNTGLYDDPEEAQAAAFMVVVIVVWLALIIVRILLQLAAKIVFNARGSRLGGALLGMARGAVVVVIVLFGAGLWPNEHVQRKFVEHTFTGGAIRRCSSPVIKALGRVRVKINAPEQEDE